MDGGTDVATPIYDQAIKEHGLTRVTLFEQEGLDPSKEKSDLPLTPENVVKEWRKGYGLVTMVGHGSYDGIYRLIWTQDDGDAIPNHGEIDSPPYFTYDDVYRLEDSRPSFVFHNSCSNGTPEYADNLGYGLLLNGAVGTVSSTRVAFAANASIFHVARDSIAVMVEHNTIGEALGAAKEKLPPLGDLAWYTRLEVALYGDPSLSLTACTVDADCNDGKACNGKETCKAGQCLAGAPVQCRPADPCMDAVCDESSGACAQTPRPEGEPCDDGKFCTVNDSCQAGLCAGQPRCDAPGNPCVAPSCDEKNRTCDVAPTAEGQACHAGTEREGTCGAGLCNPFSAGGGCALSRSPAQTASGAAGALLLALAALALQRRRRGRESSEPTSK